MWRLLLLAVAAVAASELPGRPLRGLHIALAPADPNGSERVRAPASAADWVAAAVVTDGAVTDARWAVAPASVPSAPAPFHRFALDEATHSVAFAVRLTPNATDTDALVPVPVPPSRLRANTSTPHALLRWEAALTDAAGEQSLEATFLAADLAVPITAANANANASAADSGVDVFARLRLLCLRATNVTAADSLQRAPVVVRVSVLNGTTAAPDARFAPLSFGFRKICAYPAVSASLRSPLAADFDAAQHLLVANSTAFAHRSVADGAAAATVASGAESVRVWLWLTRPQGMQQVPLNDSVINPDYDGEIPETNAATWRPPVPSGTVNATTYCASLRLPPRVSDGTDSAAAAAAAAAAVDVRWGYTDHSQWLRTLPDDAATAARVPVTSIWVATYCRDQSDSPANVHRLTVDIRFGWSGPDPSYHAVSFDILKDCRRTRRASGLILATDADADGGPTAVADGFVRGDAASPLQPLDIGSRSWLSLRFAYALGAGGVLGFVVRAETYASFAPYPATDMDVSCSVDSPPAANAAPLAALPAADAPFDTAVGLADAEQLSLALTSPVLQTVVRTSAAPLNVTVGFRCAAEGSALVRLELAPLNAAAIDPLRLYFRKRCVRPALNIGSSDQKVDVLSSLPGVTRALWLPTDADATAAAGADPDSSDSDKPIPTPLWAWLDPADANAQWPIAVRATAEGDDGLRASIVTALPGATNRTAIVVTAARNRTAIVVTAARPVASAGAGSGSGSGARFVGARAFEVTAECPSSLTLVDRRELPLRVAFDIGWRHPVTVAMVKPCPLAHPLLTAVAVTFILLSLALGLGCIAGCAYNKFHRQRSGWQVVPCLTPLQTAWRVVRRRCFCCCALLCDANAAAIDAELYDRVNGSATTAPADATDLIELDDTDPSSSSLSSSSPARDAPDPSVC